MAKIVFFSDASHATNVDQSSQLGYIIFLTDNDNWYLLEYNSYKSRRVVRSTLAVELLSLDDPVDAAIMQEHELETIHGKKMGITLLTDAKSLFDGLAKTSTKTEKKLMIDLKATRETYDTDVINYLGWINREFNLADSFTKIHVNDALKDFMLTGRFNLSSGEICCTNPRSRIKFIRTRSLTYVVNPRWRISDQFPFSSLTHGLASNL